MGAGRKALAVLSILVATAAVVSLLYWLGFKDLGVFGAIGCVAVFAVAFLLGRNQKR